MCSSTTFSSSRRRLQRAKPSGAGERVSAINFASATPSKIRGRAELGLYLRLNTASNPSSTSWRLVRSIVAMLVSSAAAIRPSLQPSPSSDTSAFSRMRAFVRSCAERLPLRINTSSWARSSALNRTTYFLTVISFAATNHLHRCLAATEIQKLPSFSMTGATIPRSRHDPKILWVDDAKIVGDRIAEIGPVAGNFFAQETERRMGELGASCGVFVVRDVSVHDAP